MNKTTKRLDAPPLSLRELDRGRAFNKVFKAEPHLKPIEEAIVMTLAKRAAAAKLAKKVR